MKELQCVLEVEMNLKSREHLAHSGPAKKFRMKKVGGEARPSMLALSVDGTRSNTCYLYILDETIKHCMNWCHCSIVDCSKRQVLYTVT